MSLLEAFKFLLSPTYFQNALTFFMGGGDDPEYVPIRPARVTTGFGTGRADPEKGKYTYTLDPRLAAMRDIFYGAAPQFMPSQAEQDFARGVSDYGMGVFGQGQEFLNQALGVDPRQVGQQYYSDVMNLMQTDRAQEEARLASNLFRTGRTGAAVGTQGGYVNPEQFALLRARELANQQLAIQAEDLGRSRRQTDTGFAANLLGTGLSTYGSGKQTAAAPYQTMAGIFGLGTGIEQLGMQNTLGTAMSALPFQMQVQANQQAYENAKAASGGKGGLGGLVQTGLDLYGASQGMPGLGSIGSSISSIWSGSSPSSGLSSLFGNIGSAWGAGNIGSWTPINTNIGMGGYTAPANFGGGTIGPRF